MPIKISRENPSNSRQEGVSQLSSLQVCHKWRLCLIKGFHLCGGLLAGFCLLPESHTAKAKLATIICLDLSCVNKAPGFRELEKNPEGSQLRFLQIKQPSKLLHPQKSPHDSSVGHRHTKSPSWRPRVRACQRMHFLYLAAGANRQYSLSLGCSCFLPISILNPSIFFSSSIQEAQGDNS